MTAGTTPTTSEQTPAIADGTTLDGIRRKVFMDRYALKGGDGTPLEEYPEQMWRRVARGIAAVEPTARKRAEWSEKFYELLRDFKFVPGGRILSGAGTGHEVTYYNCYVVGLGENPLDPDAPSKPMLDPDAARPAFFTALAQMTDIMSRSGGVGMNLSALPPKCTPIQTGGRGKNGVVRPTVALSLRHPDVMRLLDEKDGPNLAHVDVAVIVPPEFDRALADDADWSTRWEETPGETFKARELWTRVTACEGRPVAILRSDAPMLSIDDSRDAIVDGAAQAAMALFHGAPLVVDFSRLRPRGAYIKTVNGTSSGPVAWMYLYDAVARADDGAAPSEKGVIWFGEIASVITGKTIQQGGCFGGRVRIATDRGVVAAAELADLLDAGEVIHALTHRGPRRITSAFRNGSKELFDVVTGSGDRVQVTAEHRLAVPREDVPDHTPITAERKQAVTGEDAPDPIVLTPLRELSVGSRVYLLNPRTLALVTETIARIEPLGKAPVYDFEVDDVHLISGNNFYTSNSRRGALMLMLDDDHPDIEEFIAAKHIDPVTLRPVMIEHANMSLCISDAFMDAVRADLPWDLKWQGRVVRTVRARDIWDKICEAAWNTAEPGVVFMQRYQERSNTWYFENIRCVNPCGEQGLPPGGVCNLGALNLACYVDDDGKLLEDDLARDAAHATRFLDDVIDATPYFSDLHVTMQRERTRRTGLGTMGLADALIKMKVAYGSEESLGVIDRIYRVIRDASYRASVALAKEKGPCGGWEREKYAQGWFIKRLPQDVQDAITEHGIRNGVLLTQAPTGTTSLLAGVSSGIEPVYDFAMKRVDRLGEHIMYHPLLQEWMDAHPGETRPPYFVGAKDLTPEEHIVVQAKVQEYTDSSISKTSNAPFDHTVDDVKRLYTLAYDLGCKGVTYYRDGSRDAVLTSVTAAPAASAPAPEAATSVTAAIASAPEIAAPASDGTVPAPAVSAATPAASGEGASKAPRIIGAGGLRAAPAVAVPPATATVPAGLPAWVAEGRLKRRPSEMGGFTRNVAAPEGKVNITINSDEDGPLELFINVGRAGSDIAALAEALGRLISLQLRLPSTMSQEERLRQVANQLRGIGGSRSIGFGKERVHSLPDAVAQAIYRHLEEHPAPAHMSAVPAAQLALPVSDTLPDSPSSNPPANSPASAAQTTTSSAASTTSATVAPGLATASTATIAPGASAAATAAPPITAAAGASGVSNGHAGSEPAAVTRPVLTGNLCPQCGSGGAYVYEEGCRKCHNCGYSEC